MDFEAASRFQAVRNGGVRLSAVALMAGIALIAFAPSARAEVGAQGTARIVVGEGPAGKALVEDGVRIAAGGIATATPLDNGRTRVELPVREVTTGDRSAVSLAGSIIFERGKRKVYFRRLVLVSKSDQAFVLGNLGEERVRVLVLGARAGVDPRVGTVSLSQRSTGLSGRAARFLSARFGPVTVSASKVGRTNLSSQAAFEDPFAATCQLPATTKVPGNLQRSPLPVPVEGGSTAVGDQISWGIRSGLRNYLAVLPDSQGVMQGLDGGVVLPPPAPPPAPQVPQGFQFPFADGSWSLGEEEAGDEKVLLEGSGSILLCHKTQFRILLSNPKIVIDGFDARLLFDVDTNVLGEWIPGERVKLAQLVTSEGTVQTTEDSISYQNVPVILTAVGSDALRLAPFSPTFRYQAGQALQTISFTLSSTPPG